MQNFLAQRATSWLAQKLHTKVALKHVRLDILSRVSLEGLYIEDQKGDTLLYAGDLQVRITDWFIMKDKPVISYAGLRYAYVNLHRPRNSDQWNYQFVLDAFASKPTAKKDKTSSQPQIGLSSYPVSLKINIFKIG